MYALEKVCADIPVTKAYWHKCRYGSAGVHMGVGQERCMQTLSRMRALCVSLPHVYLAALPSSQAYATVQCQCLMSINCIYTANISLEVGCNPVAAPN